MKDVQNKVKKHLEKYGSITDLQCLNKYKGRRLSAVIHRLRGTMKIDTVMMEQKDSPAKYAKYKLIKP